MGKMNLSNVVRGKQKSPLRVVLYGADGVGKSSFGANAPNSIFLCAEDGTNHLDVARFPSPQSWADVIEAVETLITDEHDFRTLVIDTLDWLEPLCWAKVCYDGGKRSVEDFGFGKGYIMALDVWRSFLARLDALVRVRKMNIVMLAHAQVKRVERPDHEPFDRYLLKLHDKTAALIREWADAVLFSQHELQVQAGSKKEGTKAKGRATGNRVMRTEWSAAYDAKNRFELPPVMPLDWAAFEEAATNSTVDISALRVELDEAISALPQAEQPKARTAASEWAGSDPRRLHQLLNKVRSKLAITQEANGA